MVCKAFGIGIRVDWMATPKSILTGGAKTGVLTGRPDLTLGAQPTEGMALDPRWVFERDLRTGWKDSARDSKPSVGRESR